MNTESMPDPTPLVMPALPQTIALAFGGIAITVLFIVASAQCRRYRTSVPLLLLVAGFCTVALEPIVGLLGHGSHPVVGQLTLFKTLGRSIPVHIGLIYTFYYGSVYILLYPRLMKGPLTESFTWRLFWATVVGAFVFEVVPLQAGLWRYSDPQALWVWRGGMPIFWVVANAVSVIVPLTLIKICLPDLKGWRQLLVIPLSPMGAIMGHVGTGFPFYIAANSNVSQWTVELGGILSFGLALLAMGECARVLALPAIGRRHRGQASPFQNHTRS